MISFIRIHAKDDMTILTRPTRWDEFFIAIGDGMRIYRQRRAFMENSFDEKIQSELVDFLIERQSSVVKYTGIMLCDKSIAMSIVASIQEIFRFDVNRMVPQFDETLKDNALLNNIIRIHDTKIRAGLML